MNLLKTLGALPFAFGGAALSGEGGGYGLGQITEEAARELLIYALERGVTIFDTAPIYGHGESEKRIGQAFHRLREKVFLISKSGVHWHNSKRVDMTNDPKITKKMLEESLRRLNSDYIDLYMIHWPDKNVDIRYPLDVLAKAQREGKIKHIGLCNTNESDFYLSLEVAKIEVIQSELNIFNRQVCSEILPLCQREEVSFMSWGTLDKGILTGRVDGKRKFDKTDCRSWAPWWKAMDKERKYKQVDQFRNMLKNKKHQVQEAHDLLSLALAHNLLEAGVTSLLCGPKSIEQLEEILVRLETFRPELWQDIVTEALEIVESE